MSKLPSINRKHKICVICEGAEDHAYFERLCKLGVWNDAYDFKLVNAKSASNIPARYQNEFQNDNYELVLIFCDTDKEPYREYGQIKAKIDAFHGGSTPASQHMIIYANPCTMQIVLSHFGDVSLKNQGKKTNADIIEKFTGVKNYDAHKEQIEEICSKIFRRTYPDMRSRVQLLNHPNTVSGSTNFIVFLEHFEEEKDEWIEEIRSHL